MRATGLGIVAVLAISIVAPPTPSWRPCRRCPRCRRSRRRSCPPSRSSRAATAVGPHAAVAGRAAARDAGGVEGISATGSAPAPGETGAVLPIVGLLLLLVCLTGFGIETRREWRSRTDAGSHG